MPPQRPTLSPYEAALDKIYRAAIGENGWDAAMEAVLAATGYDGAAFYAWGRGEEMMGGKQHRHSLWHKLSHDPKSDYEQHYFQIDPRIRHIVANPSLRIVHDYMHTPENEIDRSEYYDWYQKTQPTRYYIGGRSTMPSPVELGVTLHRRANRGPAGRSDIILFEKLFTHLERAAEIEYRLDAAAGASLRFEDNDSGIVLLRKDGSLLHANAAARNMARQEDGFRIAPTGITADHPPDNAMLQKLIGHSLAKAEAGPVLRITRQSGRDDFLVMASPIPAESHVFSALRPALCLLITDPAARLSAPIAGLRKLFGLTQAQAKVAAALVSGLQVEEAAAELGISPYTVRFHVAAVLKKTGTTRQHDLVRLLTSIPWQTLTRIQAD